MPTPIIRVTNTVDPAVERVVGDGLSRFNHGVAGYTDQEPLAVVVEDPVSGQVVGGATGRTSLGLLFLDLFYLPEDMRGRGVGTDALGRFEAEGRRRGCRAGLVMTISFHAPGSQLSLSKSRRFERWDRASYPQDSGSHLARDRTAHRDI